MAQKRKPDPRTANMVRANEEANGFFIKLGEELDKQAKEGVGEIDVLKTARLAGLDIDEAELQELQIDRIVFPIKFVPWHCWYPWRPLWCWWWKRYYPWYRCCNWWWHRCHFYHYAH